MSFKAVWGFDPEHVEKAKQRLKLANDVPNELGAEALHEELVNDDWAEIPSSFETQVYELRRMFRLWRK